MRKRFHSAQDAYAFIQEHQISRWEIIGQGKGKKVILNYNWRRIYLLSLLRKMINFVFVTLDLD